VIGWLGWRLRLPACEWCCCSSSWWMQLFMCYTNNELSQVLICGGMTCPSWFPQSFSNDRDTTEQVIQKLRSFYLIVFASPERIEMPTSLVIPKVRSFCHLPYPQLVASQVQVSKALLVRAVMLSPQCKQWTCPMVLNQTKQILSCGWNTQ
jgi:hypothetical protein